jgi:hypothetical protein
MELVQIPIQELEKVWGIVEKDIKSALAYSGQLTDSDFVLDILKMQTANADKIEGMISYLEIFDEKST